MNALDFLLEPFDQDFMRRAWVAAALAALGGGLIGPFLILRRMALMGDALSHSLLPGVALAWLVAGPSPAALFLGALLAGLFTALGGALVSRLTLVKEDAAFGALYLVLFALGIVIAAQLPTRVHLTHFLLGNILGVATTDLWLIAGTVLATLAGLFVLRRPLVLESFDPLFHRAIGGPGRLVQAVFLTLVVLNLVAGLQIMGVILSLGLFILPAVIARQWCENLAPLLALSATIGVSASFLGILLSYYAALPSGPAVALVLGGALVLTFLFAPEKGLLARLLSTFRARGSRRHSLN